MKLEKKIHLLQRLLDQSEDITLRRSSSDAKFRTWKNSVERTLIRIFGADSPEVGQFGKLRFFYSPTMWFAGDDFTQEHLECFDRDFSITTSSIRGYIEELQEDLNEGVTDDGQDDDEKKTTQNIFISHATHDCEIVEELVDLLEVIGIPGEVIFCTSLDGYGIDLGENFLEAIRDEISGNTMVLFILSKAFYSSPFCLCEMGAAWVQAKDHIPILIPPLGFSDIKGVIPLTQGFRIDDALKMNLFKEKIESTFCVVEPIGLTSWERKRDRGLARIHDKIALAETGKD